MTDFRVNRGVLLGGALVTIPLLVFLALGFRADPHQIDSPLIGRPAPLFSLHDLDGRMVRLEELRGRPVVLNFWATWCQPCIVEHPVLQAGAQRYAGRAEFVGVIYQDEPELIREFVRTRGAWGPSLIDQDVSVALAYGVYGAPETFLIDRQGVIVEKVTGLVTPERLTGLLEPLL